MHGQLLPSGRFAAAPDCYSCRRGRRLRLCYDRSFWAGAKQLLKATDYFSQPEAAAGVRNGCAAFGIVGLRDYTIFDCNKQDLSPSNGLFAAPRIFSSAFEAYGDGLALRCGADTRERARSQGAQHSRELTPSRPLFFRSSSCPSEARN